MAELSNDIRVSSGARQERGQPAALGGQVPVAPGEIERTNLPRDNEAYRFPVAVKGVVIRDGNVILLRNDRDEWELPGGKLELCESPEECLAREIAEELQLAIVPESILDSWLYSIVPGVHVVVIAYGCRETSREEAVLSDEHKELRWFPLAEIDSLRMPGGYKASIKSWAARARTA